MVNQIKYFSKYKIFIFNNICNLIFIIIFAKYIKKNLSKISYKALYQFISFSLSNFSPIYRLKKRYLRNLKIILILSIL